MVAKECLCVCAVVSVPQEFMKSNIFYLFFHSFIHSFMAVIVVIIIFRLFVFQVFVCNNVLDHR